MSKQTTEQKIAIVEKARLCFDCDKPCIETNQPSKFGLGNMWVCTGTWDTTACGATWNDDAWRYYIESGNYKGVES